MKALMVFAAVVLLVLPFLISVQAISCYQCSSSDQPNCRSDDAASLEQYKIDCNTMDRSLIDYKQYNRCAKTIMNGELARACYSADAEFGDGCKSVSNTAACLCATSYCNSGPVRDDY